MSNSKSAFVRPQAAELVRRLGKPRRFLQVIAGARQVGKTTLVALEGAGGQVCLMYYEARKTLVRAAMNQPRHAT